MGIAEVLHLVVVGGWHSGHSRSLWLSCSRMLFANYILHLRVALFSFFESSARNEKKDSETILLFSLLRTQRREKKKRGALEIFNTVDNESLLSNELRLLLES
jgi:hypothetical protein